MKNLSILIILIIYTVSDTFGQDSTFVKINEWMSDNNFAIRKTFDGSKNENKPAVLSFQENHKTDNDFINIDLAIKLSELELLKNKKSILLFYPKVEWHKSNDSTNTKNKLEGGVNFEYIPFGLKSPNLPDGVPNDGLLIAPMFQGASSYKRNIIDEVNETKLTFQFSLVSNYKYLPGSNIRDNKEIFRARYYPYFGVEYNYLPDLITKGVTEEFFTYFIRLYAELWVISKTLQLNVDGTYRKIINNNSSLNTSLPILVTSLNLYPGRQESLGIGYEYKHGYESSSKFNLVQISSLKLTWKI